MSADEAARPVLRVVRGEPTAEDLAALVAVLSTAGAPPAADEAPRSRWAARSALVRRPLDPGPGAWRASGRPG